MAAGATNDDLLGQAVSAPQDVASVVAAAAASLDQALEVQERTNDVLRGRATILVPGLNEQVENTVPFNEGLLFAVSRELAVQVTASKPSKRCAGLLFSSAGGAASAANAFSKEPATALPDQLFISVATITDIRRDLDRWREANSDTSHVALFIIGPKNSRGDSVILDIEDIMNAFPTASVVLVNPDLDNTADNNAIGIREIQRRREVLDSFRDFYYFRPLFSVKRPSLIPVERGLLIRDGVSAKWKILACNSNPGPYVTAGQFDKLPSRQEIASTMESSKFLLRRVQMGNESVGVPNDTNTFLFAIAVMGLVVVLLSLAFSQNPGLHVN